VGDKRKKLQHIARYLLCCSKTQKLYGGEAMWSDNETDIDLLNYSHLVAVTLSIIKNQNLLPSTIGIFGDWGSGKSSLLKIIQSELEKDSDVLCINFNGWLFEGYDDAKTSLMEAIIRGISEKRTLDENAKKIFSDLIRRINWLRIVSSLGKYAMAYSIAKEQGLGLAVLSDVPALAKGLSEKIANSKVDEIENEIRSYIEKSENTTQVNIKEFHRDFKNLIEETKIKTLVVIIDDLDRCLPDTIIETLEAIRLFLYTPQTVFIIGVDEKLVQYAVRSRFKDASIHMPDLARDYLEKLVQIPVRIPILGKSEIEAYVNLLFINSNVADKDDFNKIRVDVLSKSAQIVSPVSLSFDSIKPLLKTVPAGLSADLNLARYLAPILAVGLNGNPRQTKRFLNMLMMRINMAQSRHITLEKRILAKLMLLEYLKSDSFRQLAAWTASQNGKPSEMIMLENETSKPKKKSPEKKIEPASTSSNEQKLYESIKKIWIEDVWLNEWLISEPKLSNCDLRPYFFFSRDILSISANVQTRMSPGAQEILGQISSGSKAIQNSGFTRSTSLSPVDAASIFSVLSERVRQQEQFNLQGDSLDLLMKFVEKRPELSSQLISALNEIPEDAIPIVIVPRLVMVFGETPFVEEAKQLLKRWSEGRNKMLAQAAGDQVKN
jgi:predicted KAP-like P-loop ATPase